VIVLYRWTGAAVRFATTIAIRKKYGDEPSHIPDYLALAGDTADGYPGVPKLGRRRRRVSSTNTGTSRNSLPACSATILNAPFCSEAGNAANGRTLFSNVDELRWSGVKTGICRVC
jgi:hypothetical protein